MRFIALYAPSSVQRVIDFVKTVFLFEDYQPIIIKPIGAAAQIGVPEAYKIAYREKKSLIILPEITDIIEVLGINKVYYLDKRGEEIEIHNLKKSDIAIVINGGDREPSKKELLNINIVKVRDADPSLPPVGLTAITLYLLSRDTMQHNLF
ncbi:RecB-family nuclease [Staphylothermus hellenicus]|uniref:RecB-family nuclease-like protein n=1 Tax=Staphylothermus hellenicus (strain DSM 12710 / JCM 10830 / BK20S6-10-b1 / P8) TaxID=591019 RepID=D7DA37_STAHD|nr:RecB-family nuclease [Staphylothermus hellenicus]ADI32633.1 RecB-family nuclease-like protein [Staphylothermus hellenicus DSM 12710]